jgi:hypothetical protein
LSVGLLFLALSRDGAFSQSFRLSAGDARMSTFAKGFVGGIMGTEPPQRFPRHLCRYMQVRYRYGRSIFNKRMTACYRERLEQCTAIAFGPQRRGLAGQQSFMEALACPSNSSA